MFWRFIGLARDCGAVTFELQRSWVVLRGSKRIFASVRISARSGRARQAGPEDSARRPDPQGRAVDQDAVLSCLRRLGIDDLDAAFALLLCEARDVGDGKSMAD
jgi:hypothetical protein